MTLTTRRLLAFGVALFLFVPLITSAQPAVTVNPKLATFAASPDHAATLPDSSPAVTRYMLEVYDGATLARSTDVGKPAPVNGDISVPLTNQGLKPNTTYTFHVLTVGPSGSTRSATASNPFAWVDAPRPASNLRAS